MNILGIVAEYNPFHLGHKYQLDLAKKISGCDAAVIVMSGNFVQRGEPAIVDKYTRASIAVQNFADLVIELPFPFSCQNAELFAYGAIQKLKEIGATKISFGCENADIKSLQAIADIQLDVNGEYQANLKRYINVGISYPLATENALKDTLNSKYNNISSIPLTPNNTLALEYIKTAKKLNYKVEFIPIQRHIAQYNDMSISKEFASATAIRNEIYLNKLSNVKATLPSIAYEELNKYYIEKGMLNKLENYLQFIYYKIITLGKAGLVDIYDISEGIENKIYTNAFKYNTLDEYVMSIKSKRYTYARIRRILLNILLDIKYEDMNKLKSYDNHYVKALAFNDNGKGIIKNAQKNGTIVITKYSDYKRNNIDTQKDITFQLTDKSSNIYYMPFNQGNKYFNSEYTRNVIYIK